MEVRGMRPSALHFGKSHDSPLRESQSMLGTKLLQGWTMLAEACPKGCTVPLMELKSQKRIVCVSCHTDYVRTSDGDFIEKLTAAARSYSLPQGANLRTSLNEKENLRTFSLRTSITTSKELKNVKKSKEGMDFGQKLREEDEYEQQNEPKDQQQRQQEEDEQERLYLEKRRRTDEASKAIGEKLLMGWALLGEVCPGCSAPLMRDKEKQMRCVSCNTFVVSRDEFDPAKHQLVSPNAVTAPSLPAGARVFTDPGSWSSSNTETKLAPPVLTSSASLSLRASLNHAINGINTTTTDNEFNNFNTRSESRPTIPPSNGFRSITLNSMKTVYSTLEKTCDSLTLATSAEESMSIVALIKGCAEAINALQSIMTVD